MADVKQISQLLPNNIVQNKPQIGTAQDNGSKVQFSDVLKSAMNDVNSAQLHADDAVQGLIKGDTNIQDAMISLQKADVSLKLMLQVRNKVLEAYQEVMRTQV